MYEYLKKHQEFVEEKLIREGKNYDWEGLREFHLQQIEFLQHERLVHLLVMLFVGLFLMLSVLGTFMNSEVVFWWSADILFLGLAVPYVIHYYHLENGVQYFYHLANKINARCGKISADYENKNRRKNH